MSYFAGGFNGGSSIEFLKMCDKISTNIEKDLQNGYIAIWHDESHLNRYFLDNPPTKILDPGYCYPESWGLPFSKKLLALDKNHEEMRS
jgi:histo-blood group ABO system transferase